MFDRIRQRLALRQRHVERPAPAPGSAGGINPADDHKLIVLDQLQQASARDDRVAVRDLHRLSGLPQSVALRALRALEEDGLVEREENLFDALAGEVRLK